MVSFDYIRDMPTLRIVVTENCELCEKGLKSLGYLNNLFTIKKVSIEEGYEEFLLRVPVVLYGKKVLDEGILSQFKILKNFLKYKILKILLNIDF
tara:strand:+ start:367 stop:651 length:285 start_codon:yes stop_codon:yes gene_type:complete